MDDTDNVNKKNGNLFVNNNQSRQTYTQVIRTCKQNARKAMGKKKFWNGPRQEKGDEADLRQKESLCTKDYEGPKSK